MADQPTTGDPKVDALVRAQFSEAIELAALVLRDRHPEIPVDAANKTAAVVIMEVWRPLAMVVTGGIALQMREEESDGTDTVDGSDNDGPGS